MAAIITYVSNRVTISWAYKEFVATTGSSTTLARFWTWEQPTLWNDKWRLLLWCKWGTEDTSQWQVRKITNVIWTAVYVNDAFIGTPSEFDVLRVSSNMNDIITAQPTAWTENSTTSYWINWDLELASDAFMWCLNQTVEWVKNTMSMNMALWTVIQLWLLIWWENNGSTETIEGCRWGVKNSTWSGQSIYSSSNNRATKWFVVNYYGSLIESSNESASKWMFQRMRWPTRFIGCIFDWPMGWRFYHEKSEVVQSRFSWNNSSTPAWSIGATFERDMDELYFFQNLYALKNYTTYSWTFRNVTFADSNTYILNRSSGSASWVHQYIDCTEFGTSKMTWSGWVINQYRWIKLSTTDSAWVALEDSIIWIINKDWDLQWTAELTDVSWIANEILALRSKFAHSSTVQIFYSPYKIRTRNYGYVWSDLSSAIADPIKQSQALWLDVNVTYTPAQCIALEWNGWITFSEVSAVWEWKNWGITVEADHNNMSVEDVKHYINYYLTQDSSIWGNEGIIWHDFIPMAWTETQNGDYWAVTKWVRVVTQSWDAFPWITRMQSDDGTYYSSPDYITITAANILQNSRYQVYNETQAIELENAVAWVSWISYTAVIGTWEDIVAWDIIRIRVTYQSWVTAKLPLLLQWVASIWTLTFIDSQEDDTVYIAYGIDGSTISTFTADFVDDEIDLVVASNFPWTDLYAWWVYNLTTSQGIQEFFGWVTALDEANLRINNSIINVFFDNTTTSNVYQTDNIRIYRADEAYPVKDPTTWGGWIDIVWRSKVYIGEVNTTTIISWVNTSINAQTIDLKGSWDKDLTEVFNNSPTIDTGAIADAVWDEQRSGHTTAWTYGEELPKAIEKGSLLIPASNNW